MLRKAQLSGGNYQYVRHPFSYFLESMQRIGITQIEMYAASPHMYVYDYDAQAVKGIRKMLDDAGIRPICLTAEQCMIPVSLSLDDEAVRKRSLQYYELALEQAAALGAPLMHMVAGSGYIGGNPEEDRKRALEGIHHVVKRAETLGVTIALEADRGSPIKNTRDIRAVIDEMGSDNIGGLLDTNAIYHAGETLEQAMDILGDDFLHMHFIDITREKGCLVPGEGMLPLEEDLEILNRRNYQGCLTPELWGFTYLNEAEDAMRRSVEFCWRHMQ